MTRGSHSQSEHLCDQCDASFFTKEGLEKHFQRQHGIYCESCPIDTAVQKITDIKKGLRNIFKGNMESTVNPAQLIQQYKKSRIYLGKKNLN